MDDFCSENSLALAMSVDVTRVFYAIAIRD